MPRLLLTLLGPFQATIEGNAIAGFESNKVRALLAYLAVEADRPHPREKLAGLLWPDWPEKSARNNLRYALANLRQAIGDREVESPLLCISRQTIQVISGSELEVDANNFSALLEKPNPTPQDLETAIKLYAGRFMEGFSVPDSTAFEEWALLKREYYDRLMLSALHRLASAYEERGEYEPALALAWRQVDLEPWNEESQRQLMRLLALNGQRSTALAQYEACRRTLAKELDVQPSHETDCLYEQIRDGGIAGPGAAKPAAEENPDMAAAHLARPPVSVPEKPGARPASGTTVVRKRLPLIPGILALLIILLGVIGIASGTLNNWISLGGSSSLTAPPTAHAIVPQPAESKLAEHCEDMQHQPHICIAYPGKNDNLNPLPYDLPFLAIGPALVWSPDGNQIALSAQSFPPKPDERGLKLFIIAADGSQIRQITTGNTDDIVHDWSPDGKLIAFHRNEGDLWVTQPDGSGAHPILPGNYYVLTSAWSPDSQMLAFLSRPPADSPTPSAIWIVQWDGSNPRVLYTFERRVGGCQIGWKPDGRFVAGLCRYGDTTEENKLLLDVFGNSAPTFADSAPPSWFQNYWPRWE